MKTILLKTFTILFMVGCAAQAPTKSSYIPGLGEMMTQISYRHGKLWFAGQAQNWELANYELEEIEEGLADVSQFHPSHKEIKAIPEQIAQTMNNPIKQTAAAIHNQNLSAFKTGYDAITAGCNTCHQANGFGFNVIVRPEVNVYSNQRF